MFFLKRMSLPFLQIKKYVTLLFILNKKYDPAQYKKKMLATQNS